MPRPTKAELQTQLQALQNRLQQVEQALQRMRNLVEMVLEVLPGVLLLLNESGVITEVELAGQWRQRWQSSQLVGQPVSALLSPTAYDSLRPVLSRVRSEQRAIVFEHTGLGDDAHGTYEWRLFYRPSLGTLALIRRLEVPHTLASYLRDAPEQAQRLNRLTRLGELVAGLVHELNQPLTVILHYGQGCLRRLASGSFDTEELRRAAEQIAHQAEWALQIMQRIRRFLRGQSLPFAPVNLNAIVHETLALLAPEIQELGVEVQLQLERDLPDVLGDALQLTQVLVNLLRNALEAVADRPQRQITLSTHRLAQAVEVCVCDTGPGLSAEVLQRLFEPFFTTKPDGLGMGLAISRSLVQAHGGELLAENIPGGARFRVRLPIPAAATSRS